MNKDGRFETREVHFSWHQILESDAGTPACNALTMLLSQRTSLGLRFAGRSARITST